jgi:hypothetical protein
MHGGGANIGPRLGRPAFRPGNHLMTSGCCCFLIPYSASRARRLARLMPGKEKIGALAFPVRSPRKPPWQGQPEVSSGASLEDSFRALSGTSSRVHLHIFVINKNLQ